MTESNEQRHWYDATQSNARKVSSMAPHHQLVSDAKVRAYSMGALRLAILSDSITAAVLFPNYPILAWPGAHEVSKC